MFLPSMTWTTLSLLFTKAMHTNVVSLQKKKCKCIQSEFAIPSFSPGIMSMSEKIMSKEEDRCIVEMTYGSLTRHRVTPKKMRPMNMLIKTLIFRL